MKRYQSGEKFNVYQALPTVFRNEINKAAMEAGVTDKVTINLDTRIVEVDNQQVHLTNKEYAILELLAMRKGTVLTKEMFLNHLYSSMDEPEIKIIDVFVCKLRKKLANAAGGTNYIETVWGRGYMLKDYDNNQLGGGQNIWTAKLTADYSFSKNLTMIFFYDHNFSKAVISTAFPITNIRTGFTLRYNFGN